MKKIIVLVLSVALASCGSKQQEQAAANLQKEVFAVHDEVMPKSMKMEDMQASIISKYEKDTTLKAQGIKLNAEMKAASDSMYVWMNDLGKLEGMTTDAKVKYLEIQKTRGEAIKAATMKAIAEAEGFLK